MNDLLSAKITIESIQRAYARLNYHINDDGREYCLNIGAVRSRDLSGDSFNDILYNFYKKNGQYILCKWGGTTDPGLTYLKEPLSPLGCGILKAGQFQNAFGVGLHKGKYRALVQRGLFTVIRDFDRDGNRDIIPPEGIQPVEKTIAGNFVMEWYQNGKLLFREETGLNFGLNRHHAGIHSIVIGTWSGACQVHDMLENFESEMALVDASLYLRLEIPEEHFRTSYTLLDESQLD